MSFQVSDALNFARFAWEVYQMGWKEDLNATKNYVEFGQDVRGLAQSLEILSRVVREAENSLRLQAGPGRPLTWHRQSLKDIIGDYESTLLECRTLLAENSRYRMPSSRWRNIEWNVLVQPSADRLQGRIILHNSKILHVLKPFEIDLLCRVRQDIFNMHQDLAGRIDNLGSQLRRLIGVLTPNLDEELRQREQRELYFLDVPESVATRFRAQAAVDRPEPPHPGQSTPPTLAEMADALMVHFRDSTVRFASGMLVENMFPAAEQYLNLLKGVHLLGLIRSSGELASQPPGSHWPSYIIQLEEDVSAQCVRFQGELLAPDLMNAYLPPSAYSIWPERPKAQLIDVVNTDELMEEVMEVTLKPINGIERKLQLLRRMGSEGKRFRVIIVGTETPSSGRRRQRTLTIDFEIANIVLNPLYATPTSSPSTLDMILRKDERIANIAFAHLRDVLKFQQAVTGYKAWDSYSHNNVQVSFVVTNQPHQIIENACIQLWIPKPAEGRLIKRTESVAESTPQRGGSTIPRSHPGSVDDSFPTSSLLDPTGRFSGQPSSSMMTGAMPIRGQPGTTARTAPPSPGSFPPPSISSSGSFPPFGGSAYYNGPSVSATTPYPNGRGMPGRSGSISSTSTYVDGAAVSSGSGSSDTQTVTLKVGRSTGLLYQRPTKPMLVIFTSDPSNGRFAFVTVDLDDETAINPERCNCRLSGSRGGMKCPIVGIERRSGAADLSVRRLESRRGDMDWNVARLAHGYRADGGNGASREWKNVNRVSIKFPDAEARAHFGGQPSVCQCKARTEGELRKCLAAGHRGLFGEVLEHHRRMLIQYEKDRYGNRADVVQGPRDDF